MGGAQTDGGGIGWPRAIASGLLIGVVVFGVLLWAPNAALTGLSGLDRGRRVAVATTIFLGGLFVLALALRRLQRRHLI